MERTPPRLHLASRLLFYLSAPSLAAAIVAAVAATVMAQDLADRLLAVILEQIDQASLATLPPDFLTPATVQRALAALAVGLALFGLAELAVAVGMRRGARWAYPAAVVGSLFVAFTTGASAVFMLAATDAQPQAAIMLVIGAALLGGLTLLYAAIAVLTAAGRRDLEVTMA